MKAIAGIVLALMAPLALEAQEGAGKAMEVEELRTILQHLRKEGLWAEVVLKNGTLRDIKVDSLAGDTVAVREVLGPLQERPAVYALSDFHSLRELGVYRILKERAPYRGHKSPTKALLLETVFPGAGYLYIGDGRQALSMLGFAALVAGTAVGTGEEGAAGWIPLGGWIKIASLLHLRDMVGAINASSERGVALDLNPGGGDEVRLRLRYSF